MKWTRFAAVFTLAAGLSMGLTACDDDDSGTGPEPEPPTRPSNVQVTVDGTSATVTFAAGQNATSHVVTVTTNGEADRSTTLTGSTTSATFDVLTRGKTYSAQVTAMNTEGSAASGALSFEIAEEEPSTIAVLDDVIEDTTWESGRTYLLRGPIFVGRDIDGDDGVSVTLTIEPGTTILGDVDPPQGARGSYLVVTRGSRIVADANADRENPSARPNPEDVIVFTSSAPRGERTRGDWGGLVVNGRAPLNSGPEAQGEGESGFFGGTDPMDDSGILRGVRVEFAGDDVTATDQLNGIALQGVGAGTTIDYVQVHYNVDDGTEPFGGTVSQTHMVMTGIGDDSFDGTDGYQGFMQFLIAQQRADAADNGFELSNNGDTEDASPHSTAVVANATMIGAAEALGSGEISALGGGSDIGLNLREGSNYRVYNSIITGFGDAGFCVEGAVAAGNADARLAGETDPSESLAVEGVILWSNVEAGDDPANFTGCGGYTTEENHAFFETAGFSNRLADPGLPGAAFDIGSLESPPDLVPGARPEGYTAVDVSALNDGPGLVMPADGRTLRQTDYAGAVEPGTALQDAWYYGWTVWAVDGSDSRPNQNGN